MNRSLIDDLLNDINSDNDSKNKSRTTKQMSKDDNDDDDWLDFKTDSKKSTVTTSMRRQQSINDDADPDEAWNRTGGSATSYMPSFGGTMQGTFSTQGQDTLQRILNEPRPATSSGSRKFDDLFGDSMPKTNTVGDADKSRKTVRFDDADPPRPSTAPSSDRLQNRPSTGVVSSPRAALDMFSPTKTTAASSKKDNWLGFADESSDEEETPIRPAQKPASVVTTLVKTTPIIPNQETTRSAVEIKKKSLLESFLDDDRQMGLSEKITVPAKAPTNKTSLDTLFDSRTTQNKRPSTAGPSTGLSFLDNPEIKSPLKPTFDTKTDHIDTIFKDTQSDPFSRTDQSISTAIRASSSTANYDVKRLEFENNELKMTLEHMKRQHEVEVAMLEEGYKHRLEYLEKSCERRESRFKEENEHLLRQLNDRMQQYESEKSTLVMEHQRRLDELQRDRTSEVENLRAVQRQTLDHLRREHDQTIQRLKQLKEEEISTALDVTTHTRAFESVVDHMEQNAKHIDQLRLKVEAKHNSVLTDKEIEARAKEQQLKAYEERLQMQTSDFERERKNLQELISRLEVHLSEQTKLVEEERWKALQAQKRMEAMQDALNGEQRLYMEKLSRDRADIQRSKDQLLEDQKIALSSIYESRSQLADERAKLEALQKSFQEQKQRDLLQNTTIEAENRAQQKLVAEQITRLEKREQELVKREEGFLLEKRSLTELKQRLEVEQLSIKNQQDEIKQKLMDIEHANDLLKKEKERLSQLYFELHALDGKNTGKLQQMQRSISQLRQQEELMQEHYSRVSNERQTLKQTQTTSPMKKSTRINDSGFSTLQLAAAAPLLPVTSGQQSIEESAILRELRMNALHDQLYIQDEMSFLNSLSTGNHLSSRSASLSNLHRPREAHLIRTNQ